MLALTVFPTPSLNLRLLEEVLYDLPPLEGVFLHWHTHGVTATTAGMYSLLARRKQLLGPTTLSGASIKLLYECATDSLRRLSLPGQDPHSPWESRPLHARLLRHGPSLSAAKAQALLPPGVLVHKTVSMTRGETSLLCTGIGPQRVTRQHLRAIEAALVLPGWTAKGCTVNPVETLTMQPGMVSPFLHPSHHSGLGALVLLPFARVVRSAGARGGDFAVAVGKPGTALALPAPTHTKLCKASVPWGACHRTGERGDALCVGRADYLLATCL